MPDVMAIVSRKVFDKQAGAISVGDVWPVDAYVSKNRGLQPLGDGGRLFLVTVRPDAVLWLVAILRDPELSGDRWTAAANTAPVRDITDRIEHIELAGGKRLVRSAKLGMSLQTPRVVAPATADMLDGSATDEGAVDGAAVTEAASVASRATEVPTGATRDPVSDTWESGAVDERGQRQGAWQFRRDDGTLVGECTYVDDEPHGENVRYHPDGSVASRGRWRDGVLYDCSYFRPAKDPRTDEPWMRETPAIITRVDYLSDDGRTNRTIRYFDADGGERDRAGETLPERPAGVPASARFFSDETFCDEGPGGWVDGRIERGVGVKVGPWQWWTTAGRPLRTELYTERGTQLAVRDAGAPDPIEALVEAFVAEPHEFSPRYELAQVWTPELHAVLRERLRSCDVGCTAAYLRLLVDGTKETRRVWTATLYHPDRIIEVVEDWLARAGDADDAGTWLVYAVGVEAALSIGDAERAQRWWDAASAIGQPDKKQRPKYGLFSRMDTELAQRGDLRGAIDALVGGEHARRVDEARRLVTGGAAADLDDEQLALLARAELGAAVDVVLRDRQTGEAWLVDASRGERAFYFDGAEFGESAIDIDVRSRHDVHHVASRDRCDERTLFWQGKHSWSLMQRYGRRVFWHAATYFTGRGQAEVTDLMWFVAPDAGMARRVMALLAARLPRAARKIDPFMDKKTGVIMRCWETDGLATLGVYGDAWVTNRKRPRVLERFADHDAAVAAFERMEMEHMRNGGFLRRLHPTGPLEL